MLSTYLKTPSNLGWHQTPWISFALCFVDQVHPCRTVKNVFGDVQWNTHIAWLSHYKKPEGREETQKAWHQYYAILRSNEPASAHIQRHPSWDLPFGQSALQAPASLTSLTGKPRFQSQTCLSRSLTLLGGQPQANPFHNPGSLLYGVIPCLRWFLKRIAQVLHTITIFFLLLSYFKKMTSLTCDYIKIWCIFNTCNLVSLEAIMHLWRLHQNLSHRSVYHPQKAPPHSCFLCVKKQLKSELLLRIFEVTLLYSRCPGLAHLA